MRLSRLLRYIWALAQAVAVSAIAEPVTVPLEWFGRQAVIDLGGVDQPVVVGCPVVVTFGSNSLVSRIELVRERVAITGFDYPDSAAVPDSAVVYPAEILRDLPIRIGCQAFVGASAADFGFVDPMATDHGNRLEFPAVPPALVRPWFEQDDSLTALVSFREIQRFADEQFVTEQPAPYYLALVPNPGVASNRDGFLAVSLYNRWNESMASVVFPASLDSALHSHLFLFERSERAYPYDPRSGFDLLRSIAGDLPSVGIWAESQPLRATASLFIELLQRQKVPSRTAPDRSPAELWLVKVPLAADDSLAHLTYLVNLLSSVKPATPRQKEAIRLARNYVNAARDAVTAQSRLHYARLADRTLQVDLGVFPLLRPRYHFSSSPLLYNVRFDPVGRLLTDSLTLLRLPTFPGAAPGGTP